MVLALENSLIKGGSRLRLRPLFLGSASASPQGSPLFMKGGCGGKGPEAPAPPTMTQRKAVRLGSGQAVGVALATPGKDS